MSCVCEARKPNNFNVGDQRQSFQATVRSLAGLNLHSLKVRGSVSLRARLAGATGLRSARLSVLRNVIGESWTGVSPVL